MTKPTVAVSECLTSGLLADLFVSVSGASAMYKGAISPYNLQGKVDLLNIDEEHAKMVDCVSATVARQMAQAVALRLRSDVGIATTGYAEPAIASGESVLPHAFISLFETRSSKFHDQFVSSDVWQDRNQFRLLVAQKAKALYDTACVGGTRAR